jgi:hypothetical protein
MYIIESMLLIVRSILCACCSTISCEESIESRQSHRSFVHERIETRMKFNLFDLDLINAWFLTICSPFSVFVHRLSFDVIQCNLMDAKDSYGLVYFYTICTYRYWNMSDKVSVVSVNRTLDSIYWIARVHNFLYLFVCWQMIFMSIVVVELDKRCWHIRWILDSSRPSNKM